MSGLGIATEPTPKARDEDKAPLARVSEVRVDALAPPASMSDFGAVLIHGVCDC